MHSDLQTDLYDPLRPELREKPPAPLRQGESRHLRRRASLFTDHRISGRPIRAKYKHFKTI